MNTRSEPRPYVVRCRDKEGDEHEERVVAYDIQEAMLSASIACTARGVGVDSYLWVAPDVAAYRAGVQDDAEARATAWARAIGAKVSEQ